MGSANKDIDGTQCTVVWHVDDLKISHAKQSVVDEVTTMLNDVYGKVSPLAVSTGPKHDYLGMELEYLDNGTVIIGMVGYVDSILEEATPAMQGTAVTPAANHLFQVNPTPSLLSKDDADYFHHMVAKLLFICKRGHPDIQTAVAFLCTRVKQPDIDDMKKL